MSKTVKYVTVPSNKDMDQILNLNNVSDEVKQGLINLHKVNPKIKETTLVALEMITELMLEDYLGEWVITKLDIRDSSLDKSMLTNAKSIIKTESKDCLYSGEYMNKNITSLTIVHAYIDTPQKSIEQISILFGTDNNDPTPDTCYVI